MTKQIGLARQAYSGAPRVPTASVPFGQENHELLKVLPKWNFKSKRLRRAELVARM